MTELERALVALGRDLEVPPAPDVRAVVLARVGRRRRRAWLVAALALVAAIAVAFAVPQARSAILRLFHIRGATVELVDRLPRAEVVAALPGVPGEPPFRPLLPDGRRPDELRVAGEVVWLRWGRRLVAAELRTGSAVYLKKLAAGGARVRYTSVGGDPAIWVEGRHALELPGGGRRLAGNVLLWQHGALTLRLEADVPLDEARRLAASFR